MYEQTVRTDLNNVVGTIMTNQQPCSCMIEHVVREWWNDKIKQRCYNNHELGCCIKSGFACSNKREQPLSIRQAVNNMLKHDWTILVFYQSYSIMLTVLLQGCWANNPVIACDIFTHEGSFILISRWSIGHNSPLLSCFIVIVDDCCSPRFPSTLRKCLRHTAVFCS